MMKLEVKCSEGPTICQSDPDRRGKLISNVRLYCNKLFIHILNNFGMMNFTETTTISQTT